MVERRRDKTLRIRSPAQWRVLSSPVRIDLVELLAIVGPCSVARLAELLGRPADGLYHHLRRLVGAGLVRASGAQRAGKRNEALYDLMADRFRFDFDPRRPEPMLRLSAALLRMAQRDLAGALRRGKFDPPRNAFGRRLSAWLPAPARRRVLADLRDVEKVAVAARRKAQGQLYSLTLFMIPLAPSARARRRQPK